MRISRKTREAAIELLRCTADSDLTYGPCGIYTCAFNLGPTVELAIDARIQCDIGRTYADACLEAAQRLEEGWEP